VLLKSKKKKEKGVREKRECVGKFREKKIERKKA
jgi:hypothetical protein